MDRDSVIRTYFDLGLKYGDIVVLLLVEHNLILSERQLKRVLKRLKLVRRRYDNPTDVVTFISEQLRRSGRLHGYRMMYMRCKLSGVSVRMEDVRLILQMLDQEAVQIRQSGWLHRRDYFSKGPNFIWHIDGYDKLKPFGLCISGCICGFSRCIIWLNVYRTNNNPKVIGGYFMEAVQKENGCPKIVRGDYGTENVLVRDLQTFLRRNGQDDMVNRAYLEGASTSNQRIEQWWGFLRKENVHIWIELFRSLEERGEFDGGFLDKSLIQFCFMFIPQDELDFLIDLWNEHTIRPCRNPNVPSGRPSMMYLTPLLWGAENHICFVCPDEINLCLEEIEFRSTIPCHEDVYVICVEIIKRDNIARPSSPESAVDMYLHLRNQIALLI